MAFFVGASFSLSISLLFWSLAIILRAFLTEEVAVIPYKIFPLFLMIHPIYIVASILDNIYIFECRNPRLREYLVVFVPSLIPILITSLFRMSGITINADVKLSVFYSVIWAFLSMIIIGNLASAAFSALADDFRLNINFSSFWMCLHAVLVSFLIVLV